MQNFGCYLLLLTIADGGTPEVVTNSIGLQLVRLPAGEFTIGSPMSESVDATG